MTPAELDELANGLTSMVNAARAGQRRQEATDDRDNILPVPTLNWDEMCSPALRKATPAPVANTYADETDNLLPDFSVNAAVAASASPRLRALLDADAARILPTPDTSWLVANTQADAGRRLLVEEDAYTPPPTVNFDADSDNILPVPVVNWDEMCSPALRRQA